MEYFDLARNQDCLSNDLDDFFPYDRAWARSGCESFRFQKRLYIRLKSPNYGLRLSRKQSGQKHTQIAGASALVMLHQKLKTELQIRSFQRRDADSGRLGRSEEHTSELHSLMRNSYAVFC